MSDKPKRPVAVALAYTHPAAPRVVAKGEGALAEKIVETAAAHGLPIDQNPSLAAALSTIELDEEIPAELYKAVAVVIGAVLRSSNKAHLGEISSA
jgi:flagellar biosynthesis protein